MKIFDIYSEYYDLLYKDKDYQGESKYVHQLIQKYHSNAKTVLNLGCGTGRHDYELAKLGYTIAGIDLSDKMISKAIENTPPDLKNTIKFLQGDARNIVLDEKFDVVLALFHVMSYQTTNEDINAVFNTAKKHLKPDGLFIFDCWYGPGVLTDLPTVRVKRIENDYLKILRISEPTMHWNTNIVEVNFTILLYDKNRSQNIEIKENHPMRYLFYPEILNFSYQNQLSLIDFYEWLKFHQPSQKSWNAVFIVKAKELGL